MKLFDTRRSEPLTTQSPPVGRFFVARTVRAGLGQTVSKHEPPFLDTEYGWGSVIAYCNLRGTRVTTNGIGTGGSANHQIAFEFGLHYVG